MLAIAALLSVGLILPIFAAAQTNAEFPRITETRAKAAGNFEMDAGGEASIHGTNLVPSGKGFSRVFIGDAEATVTNSSASQLWIRVPVSLVPGRSYDLYVVTSAGKSNVVKVKILSNLTQANAPISVTAPNGGEQWETGLIHTVTWTPYGYNPDINSSQDVTAYLEKSDGKGGIVRLGNVQETGKASIHWRTGALNSLSDETYVQPGQYYVYVVNNKTGASDRSDRPFTITARSVDLKINGSDGPVSLVPGEQVTMTWRSSGKAASCRAYGVGAARGENSISNLGSVGTKKVYYSTEANVRNVFAECYGENNLLINSDVVKVTTNQPRPASITVLSPNGGESIQIGVPYTIRWEQKGVDRVSIALYKDDKWQEWITRDILFAKRDNETYEFPLWVPEGSSMGDTGSYKIYITGERSDGSGYVDDKSDAPFTFSRNARSAPRISAIAPASAAVGSQVTITGTGLQRASNDVYANGRMIAAFLGATNCDAKDVPTCAIRVRVPATAPGTYDVLVKNAYGTSNTVKFTVTSAGTSAVSLASISPTLAAPGTRVVLRGSGFTPTGNQIWCMSGCTYSPGVIPNATSIASFDGKSINYAVPQTPPGVYTVAVKNANGTSNTVPFSVVVASASATSQMASALAAIEGQLREIQAIVARMLGQQ